MTSDLDGLYKELAAAQLYVNTLWKARATEVINDILENTPQYSGSLNSSWVLDIEGSSHRLGVGERPRFILYPYEKGSDPATAEAVRLATSAIAEYASYGTTLVLSNDQPYAADVDAGIGPNGTDIREENLMDDGRVGMLSYVYSIYSLNWRAS